MQRLLVAVTLRPGAEEEASALVRSGPPFDLPGSGLTRHDVYVSAREAVFLFEGPWVERLVSSVVNDPTQIGMLAPWVPLTQGPPRLLVEQFHWVAERQELPTA